MMASRRRSVMPTTQPPAPASKRLSMGPLTMKPPARPPVKAPASRATKPTARATVKDDFVSGELFSFDPIQSPRGPVTRARRSSVYILSAASGPKKSPAKKAKAPLKKVPEEVTSPKIKPAKTPGRKKAASPAKAPVNSPQVVNSPPAAKSAKTPAATKSAKTPVAAKSTKKTAKTPANKKASPEKENSPVAAKSAKKTAKTPANKKATTENEKSPVGIRSTRKTAAKTPATKKVKVTQFDLSTHEESFTKIVDFSEATEISTRPTAQATSTPYPTDSDKSSMRSELFNSISRSVDFLENGLKSVPNGTPYKLLQGLTANGSPAEFLVKSIRKPSEKAAVSITELSSLSDSEVTFKNLKRKLSLSNFDDSFEASPKKSKTDLDETTPTPASSQLVTGDLGKLCTIM